MSKRKAPAQSSVVGAFEDGDEDGFFDDDFVSPKEPDEIDGVTICEILGDGPPIGLDAVYGTTIFQQVAVAWLLKRGSEYAGPTLSWCVHAAHVPPFPIRQQAIDARKCLKQIEAMQRDADSAARSRPCIRPCRIQVPVDVHASPVARAAKVELSAAAMSTLAGLASAYNCSPVEAAELVLSAIAKEASR